MAWQSVPCVRAAAIGIALSLMVHIQIQQTISGDGDAITSTGSDFPGQ